MWLLYFWEMKILTFCSLLFFFISCGETSHSDARGDEPLIDSNSTQDIAEPIETEIVVLGTAQDAGYPQIDCKKSCCQAYWAGQRDKEEVTCLGIVDRKAQKSWLIEATPDITSQWQQLEQDCPECEFSGIIITHAHIGHYTGLMHLGREAMGGMDIPVYAMPRMTKFLSENGPWSQLVDLSNIQLKVMTADSTLELSENISLTPYQVPHRDEFSETVGFKIQGPVSAALFIPDIDKWERWDRDIAELLIDCEYAFLDGTFFDGNELPGRNMNEIPHPFIIESMRLFDSNKQIDKSKIHFIHFNHTNPLLNITAPEGIRVIEAGYSIADKNGIYPI